MILALAKWAFKQMAKCEIYENNPLADKSHPPVRYNPSLLVFMPSETNENETAQEVEMLELGKALSLCRLIYPKSSLMIISKVFKGKFIDFQGTMRQKEIVIL